MIRGSERLVKVDPKLRSVLEAAGAKWDLIVLETERTPERQQQLVNSGASKTMDSMHLVQADGLVHAADVAPWPVDWNDKSRFYYLGGYVLAEADRLGVRVRWGGDWNTNTEVKDQTFNDLDHFETPIGVA